MNDDGIRNYQTFPPRWLIVTITKVEKRPAGGRDDMWTILQDWLWKHDTTENKLFWSFFNNFFCIIYVHYNSLIAMIRISIIMAALNKNNLLLAQQNRHNLSLGNIADCGVLFWSSKKLPWRIMELGGGGWVLSEIVEWIPESPIKEISLNFLSFLFLPWIYK